MPRRNHIAEQWMTYREGVIPKDAGAVQLLECRRAFYAGAAAFYSVVMGALGEGTEPTDPDLKLMQDLHEELVEFPRRVEAGLA